MKKLGRPFYWLRDHARASILSVLGLVLLIIIVILLRSNDSQLEHYQKAGEALQPFGVGLGTLLSGAAAFNYLDEWVQKQGARRKRSEPWLRKFPPEQLGEAYKLVESADLRGVLYVWNLKDGKRHWIINPKTLRWLGLNYADVETLNSDEFAKLKPGANIAIDER